jgi:hypothetical protein
MICVENRISISVNHDDTALIYVPSQSISQKDQNGIYISGESGENIWCNAVVRRIGRAAHESQRLTSASEERAAIM